ncbi:MAG: hypothetical protein AABY18_02295 [Candidatus Thermoplasmatota archaeon]
MRVAAVALACLALVLPGCLKGVGLGGSDEPGPADYVSGAKYTKWVIEMDVTQGADPPSAALTLLKSRLEGVVNKPGGIEIRRDETLPARGGTWTQDDVLTTAERTKDILTGGDTVTLHLLFLDGQYATNNVLGVTYFQKTESGRVVSSGPIAIFSDVIQETACPPPLGLCVNEDAIWQAVLVHEFGHAMGLVDTGAPMQRDHEDDAHAGHSSNRNSVMYYAVETIDIVNVFQGGPPTTYDADDKADLCALGGKC